MPGKELLGMSQAEWRRRIAIDKVAEALVFEAEFSKKEARRVATLAIDSSGLCGSSR